MAPGWPFSYVFTHNPRAIESFTLRGYLARRRLIADPLRRIQERGMKRRAIVGLGQEDAESPPKITTFAVE